MQVRTATVKLTPSGVTAMRQCGHRESWLRAHPSIRPAFQETAATARGKSLHAALAAFHTIGEVAPRGLHDLKELLARNWISEGYADPEEERLARLRSEEELEAYYRAFGRDSGTLATERTWSLFRDLDGLRTEWTGRLDWVRLLPEGVLEVVDWKSGGQMRVSEALAADPATVLYGRLGRSLARFVTEWPGGEVRFSLIFLSHGSRKISVSITREMVERAEAELAELARSLRSGRFSAAEGPWCAWNGGCPARAVGECPLFPQAQVDGEW